MIDADFWKSRRVFLTGHTGFKGSWLSLWLHKLGAIVTGYALDPPTKPSLFELCRVGELVQSVAGDVRHMDALNKAMVKAEPEIVIHMAAQPLVRDSYRMPVETYATNVMGTVHLLEAVRHCSSVRAVVNITTDKCYENREWVWGYRENEPMGGYDPYSSSKGCSELVTAAYRASFFNGSTSVASARAGNVIGGGDWAIDRLIPDCVRSLLKGEKILIRNPSAIRPWQYVLEPLAGYLILAQKLYENGALFAEAWNFGPDGADSRPVEWLVKRFCELWGDSADYEVDAASHPHEAQYLKLDCSKAYAKLGWQPCYNLEQSLESIVSWMRDYRDGKFMRDKCLRQIDAYVSSSL